MSEHDDRAQEARDPNPEEALRFPEAYAFVGSGCLLVLELVAGRILAPEIGVSLYTWTAVIGIVLAGVSLGNYLGGLLADRRPNRSTLSGLYGIAAASSGVILFLANSLPDLAGPSEWPLPFRIVWVTGLLFFVPSTLLGTMTPLLVKLSLHSVAVTGRVVGRIQAAATLGSIVGTFATGFILISWFGTRAIVAGIAVTLLVLAALCNPLWTRRRIGLFTTVLLMVGATAVTARSGCLVESSYYCIRVFSPLPDERSLFLDNVQHGLVNLKQPSKPSTGYEQLMAEMLVAVDARFPKMRALLLGGGSFTMARHLDVQHDAEVLVAEIDPAVTRVARRYLLLEPSSSIRIVHDDARRVVQELPKQALFDVIVADAYDEDSMPYHLVTKEFQEQILDHLAVDGIYMMNVIDNELGLVPSLVRTLATSFSHVGVMTHDGTSPSQGMGNLVLIASDQQLPAADRLVQGDQLKSAMEGRRSVLLTDDYAPVDQLLRSPFSVGG